MKIAAIIPSRYHSTRFEGKPLALIAGKTMIERVYRQVEKCKMFCDIITATDDSRIARTVETFGGHARMTSPNHNSGTERLWEVLEGGGFDAAVNIQGDEPIVSEKLITQLTETLATGKYPVVTPVYWNTSYADYVSRHVVKAVIAQNFQALYFSRSPVPFTEEANFSGFFQHIGLYAYLKEAVETFIKLPTSKLEKTEKLEQLRFLDNNIPIHVIQSEYQSLGVDVPEDVQRIEKILMSRERNE
jgi:3-deoxy-manno-octulosonate cytidylyltransferase (CMP-KDO synthetase)